MGDNPARRRYSPAMPQPAAASSARFAFPAMLAGSIALAFGPWLVRLSDTGPVQSAFWRMALAVLPIVVLARLTAGRSGLGLAGTPRRVWWLAALAGLFFAADLAVWHLGIVRTTLANAALLSNGASFLLPVWGIVVLRHRPDAKALTAIGCALAGTILLVGRSADLSPENLLGDLFCLAAALLYTAYLLVIDSLRGRVSAMPLLALATAFGALWLWPLAALVPGRFWPGDWTPVLLLALGSQVIGQGLVVYAIGHLRPLVVGLTLLVQPAIAATIGAWRFGEVPGLAEIGGAALVVAALVLVRWPERRVAAGTGQ